MKYQQEIQQWYIEWEPQWEDEHQVRMLGYGKIVDQTLHHLTQAPQPQPQPPKDAHLSNKDRQGNSGPTYPTTLGEPVRDTCTFITTDTDPTQTFTGQDHYTLQRREVYRRMTLGTSKKKHDYTADLVTVHDPTGRTAGHAQPEQSPTALPQLPADDSPDALTLATSLQAKTFPEELAHLLQRYKQGTKVPDSKRNVNLQNHWATP
jgi:predicted dehydrogenase